jgi:ribonuclease HI
MNARKHVLLFSDGACIPNPGPGGWAFRLQFEHTAAEMFGAEPRSTNLRMEILAAMQGLQHLKEPCDVLLITDSDYVCDGLTRWLPKWRERCWKTSEGNSVKNVDLWMQAAALVLIHRLQTERPTTKLAVALNARVDQLANHAAVNQVSSPLVYVSVNS